jgi:hypothetical protein
MLFQGLYQPYLKQLLGFLHEFLATSTLKLVSLHLGQA